MNGLAKNNRYWNEHRVSLLRTLYPKSTWKELFDAFPETSLGGIKCKAHKLGLKKLIKSKIRQPPKRKWFDEQNKVLLELYEWGSWKEIMGKLPKFSWSQIQLQASRLGLKRKRKEALSKNNKNFVINYNGNKYNANITRHGYVDVNNASIGVISKKFHRLVWETERGCIPEGYDIHHIDGNKQNNDIANLEIVLNNEHKHIERKLYQEVLKFLKLKNLEKEFEVWKSQNRNTN